MIGWSDIYSFTTYSDNLTDYAQMPQTFLMIGDMGADPEAPNTVKILEEYGTYNINNIHYSDSINNVIQLCPRRLQFCFITVISLTRMFGGFITIKGNSNDVRYSDGIQQRMDLFMRQIQTITANMPYMVCFTNRAWLTIKGNHINDPYLGHARQPRSRYYDTFQWFDLRAQIFDATWG